MKCSTVILLDSLSAKSGLFSLTLEEKSQVVLVEYSANLKVGDESFINPLFEIVAGKYIRLVQKRTEWEKKGVLSEL